MTLTKAQQAHVRQRAIETVYEDVQQNTDYLWAIVRGYVDLQSPEDQAELVSSDPSMWPELFDFDPLTGKPWPEKGDV